MDSKRNPYSRIEQKAAVLAIWGRAFKYRFCADTGNRGHSYFLFFIFYFFKPRDSRRFVLQFAGPLPSLPDRIWEKSHFSCVSTCERRLCCHCYKTGLEGLRDSYFTSLTKRVYRSHSVMRNTTSCNRIIQIGLKRCPALQTLAGELITFQIIFQIPQILT